MTRKIRRELERTLRRGAVRTHVAIAAVIAVVMLTVMISSLRAACAAEANLLNNADFARGAGASCDGWRVDAWVLTPGTTDYTWIRPEGAKPGELAIDTHHDNDARWVQTISLGPGWYYVGVEARTEKILPYFTGANISVLEDSIVSADLKGTNQWTRLGFYLHVGPRGGDVDVALRVGGFMNLNRGKAWFRRARVINVSGPPPGEQHVFDLEQIRKDEAIGPIGHIWSLVATFITFLILAAIGWWSFTEGSA